MTTEWRPLSDVCAAALRVKWTGKSEEEILEYVERFLQSVAENLRNEAAECVTDGTAARYQIDDEQLPYIRGVPGLSSQTLFKIRRINPFDVEGLCARILAEFGATTNVTQRSGDGGVDFIAHGLNIVPKALLVPVGARAIVIGQTKRYKEGNVITETKVREFAGASILRRHNMRAEGRIGPLTPVILAFWTTSDFEPSAKKYAREMGIWFMDGFTLASYVDALSLTDYVMGLPDFNPSAPL